VNDFQQSLDLIAETTGHHPLCVHIVGSELAQQFREAGTEMPDFLFLMILTDALTNGGICAGEMVADLLDDLISA
jgi:hypothetical protein